MRKAIAMVTAAGLMALLVGNAGASAPKTVVKDAAGDSGNNTAGPIPGTEQGGFDITKGSIARKRNNLVFTVAHSAMPPNGSLPEGFRFLWHINVDGKEFRFTVKSFDIGKPDVLAQDGEERVGKVYADGVYRLEQCADEQLPAVLTLVNCRALAYLKGSFNPAKKSFSFQVPLKKLKAKTGSVIAGGSTGAASSECQICWVPHYAERSLTPVTIIDNAVMRSNYKVPRS